MNLQGRALEYVAGAYALGTLNLRARRRFETLLTQDIAARRAWQQWEERLSTFAPDIPPVRPPDHTWSAIQERLELKASPRARSKSRWLLVAALLVAIAAAAILKWPRT